MNKKIKNVSQKVMVATLASSMMVMPTLNANAANYSTSQDSVLKSAAEIKEAISLLDSKGDLESASIEWKAVEGATGYNVYYKAADASDAEFKQLDNDLIRQYSSYFRADAVGLKAGSYVLKVVPIINGEEVKSEEAITENIEVKANTREGFAFSKESQMGTGSGGYNDDGTVPEDATTLYVTKDTVNTVTADVVTNSKGAKTTVTGLTNILAARQKAYDKSHLIIRMIGQIDSSDIDGINTSGYIQLKGCYNVTLEGVGEDATAYGWGILVRDAHNVEIRNIGVMLFPDDGISLDTDNENIWVHNNDIFYGTAGHDKDQAKGDGSCDTKKSDYVTVAYNHFYDSGKCCLCGMSDTEEFHVSYHHNWFDHSDSRHPRIRVGTIHVYNNYFDGNAKYGVGVTKASSAFVEANVFRNCKNPMLTSMQGTDVYNGSVGTFSKEPGGMIKAYNNSITGAARLIYANEDAEQFDAYLAESRNEEVPSTYKTVKGGTTYNNFDTKDTMYDYTPDAPEDVVDNVTTYAGRVGGGDFSWQFTEADDTDYSLNTELMAKIKSYKTDLVSVGGSSITTSKDETEKPATDKTETPAVDESQKPSTDVTETPSEDDKKTDDVTSSDNKEAKLYTHNFTTDGLEDSVFNISGNLSSSKGTVEYNGLTLTQCLKVESSSNISFTTTDDATLTLVLNTNKKINVDDTKYTAENGIVNVKLSAGTHKITKADSVNLFYISLSTNGDSAATKPNEDNTNTPEEKPSTGTTETPSTGDTEKPSETPSTGNTEVTLGSLTSNGMRTNLANAEDSIFTSSVYVSPNGAASNDGSYESPLDLATALEKAANGECSTILLQDGTYTFDSQITINASGKEDSYNVLKAAKGANVVLDFSAEAYNTKDTSTNARGIQMNGSYWYMSGITIKGAADNGMMLSGSHNVIERCIFDGNRDTGLQISRRSSSVTNFDEWPSYNNIINCTSKNNCDPATYENADGFAAKLTCGNGNVFDGCISYNNSDDGWDLFAKKATGSTGVVTIRNCIAMRNGKTEDGTTKSSCDGNGFKLGGSGVPTAHIVTNCIAIENLHHGFTDNNNPAALQITNCTAFNNNIGGGKNNFSLYRCKDAVASNCISYTTNGTSDKFVSVFGNHLIFANSKKWYKVTDTQAVDTGSSTSRGEALAQGTTSSDFMNVDVPKVGTDFDKLWRNEDGTINTNGVALVSESSDYAKFSSDNGVIGARFAANNEVTNLTVNIK